MINTVLVSLVTLLLLLWWRSRPRNPPPSPGFALPLIGHLHLFKSGLMDQLESWRGSLGNVFTLHMGPRRCVMLFGYDVISEALVKNHESLLDRPSSFAHDVLYDNAGITSLCGRKWNEQRAFLQSTFRSLEIGRNIMAERIKVEVGYLLANIANSKGTAIDISNMVTVCVKNVICGVTFGKRFNQEDKELLFWTSLQQQMSQHIGVLALVHYVPVLKYVPGDPLQYKQVLSAAKKFRADILKWTEKDKRRVNISDKEFQDVMQAYLTEMERKKMQGVTETCFDEANLVSNVLAFFNNGVEISSNTILFAVLYLVNFPDLQAKLFQAITDAVGTERVPDVTDESKLKLLSAFIMETQRFASINPFAADRVATNDFKVGGYTVAKGTVVKINLDSLLKDKGVWGDPEVFRPDRFIDHDGSLSTREEFLPFGLGKRNCLGEGLAKMVFFLVISALVQRFEFLPEKNGEFPTMEPGTGVARPVEPFKVRAIPRKQFRLI